MIELKNICKGFDGRQVLTDVSLKINKGECLKSLTFIKEKLEKIIKKMKDKYRKEGKSVLRDLGGDFKFVRVVEGE